MNARKTCSPKRKPQAQIACAANPIAISPARFARPWRWEDLIVEAAVIGRLDRWQRRLKGLEHEYDRRVREASSEDPDASRVRALVRDREQLRALRSFAEPILAEMADWPAVAVVGRLAERARAAGAARDRQARARAAHAARAGAARRRSAR